jgi:mono/diheme cytochrome c family protein
VSIPESPLSRRSLLVLVCVGGVAVLAYLAAAWQPSIRAVDPPATASLPAEKIAAGKVLAEAAGCIDCHTVKGGATAAGGVEMQRMFGTIASTNITPDPDTGIGRWSLAAFARALREGVSRDGKPLFAMAFPFDHFTRLTDGDIAALYAYLMSLPPAEAPAPPDTVPFPLDIRALQATWKALYFSPGAYRPDPSHDARWNRGAYLAEAVLRCSACHTARNLLGAESVGHPYGGGPVDGWWATALDVDPSPARWTERQLFVYLRTGESPPHGAALAAMQRVVRRLQALPDSDITAIATYMLSVVAYPPNREAALAKATGPHEPANRDERSSGRNYLAACGHCHEKPGWASGSAKSPIGLSAALWMDEPVNAVRIVLDGITPDEGLPGPTMPAFRQKLGDADIANIVEHLRTTRTTRPAWGDIRDRVTRIRADTAPPR